MQNQYKTNKYYDDNLYKVNNNDNLTLQQNNLSSNKIENFNKTINETSKQSYIGNNINITLLQNELVTEFFTENTISLGTNIFIEKLALFILISFN